MKNYYIFFYVPVDDCEDVKNAMFEAGAGKLGDYSNCSWQVLGKGQFKPENGSNPYIGEVNKKETVDEYKVEMFCEGKYLKQVLKALKNTHPYEEIAYGVFEIFDMGE